MTLNQSFKTALESQIADLKAQKVYKRLNHLASPQAAHVKMEGRGDILILSSNNYLGLCTEPEVIRAGHEGLDRYGAGTASVRFICGTFTLHRELEAIGATIVSPPREYPEYTPAGYYALYFKDPDGIKYEIVSSDDGGVAAEGA